MLPLLAKAGAAAGAAGAGAAKAGTLAKFGAGLGKLGAGIGKTSAWLNKHGPGIRQGIGILGDLLGSSEPQMQPPVFMGGASPSPIASASSGALGRILIPPAQGIVPGEWDMPKPWMRRGIS